MYFQVHFLSLIFIKLVSKGIFLRLEMYGALLSIRKMIGIESHIEIKQLSTLESIIANPSMFEEKIASALPICKSWKRSMK